MLNIPKGKGYWIWKVRYAENSDVDLVAQMAREAG